jgi:hypothetical protein
LENSNYSYYRNFLERRSFEKELGIMKKLKEISSGKDKVVFFLKHHA